MAEEKIFTPKDFDKPKDKSLWLRCKGLLHKYKSYWIAAALFVFAVIVLCCIFCGEEEQKEVEVTEQVSQKPLSSANTDETDVVTTDTTHETQKVINVKPDTNTNAVADDSNTVVKQEDSPSSEVFQPVPVSDNVEQEAINVIRGDYGNVPERRVKLGLKYQEIQDRVNQLKKQGVF